MRTLSENKLAKLHTAGELLDRKYGKNGTVTRIAFHKESIAWYKSELLKKK